MELRSRFGLCALIFSFGLATVAFGNVQELEYDIDDIYPLKVDNYENEMLVRNVVLEDGDEPDEDADNDDEEEDNIINGQSEDELLNSETGVPVVFSPQVYRKDRSEKRDMIRGPSFSPNINGHSADSDLALENSDVQSTLAGKRSNPRQYGDTTGRKYSDIEQIPERPLKDNAVDQQMTLQDTPSKKTINGGEKGNSDIEDTEELKSDDTREETGQRKDDLARTKADVSEGLIELLFDWKKHKLPRQPFRKEEAEKAQEDEAEAARTVSKLRAASHESKDFSTADEDATADVDKSSSVSVAGKVARPANEEDAEDRGASETLPVTVTATTEDDHSVEGALSSASRKSKGKINVMVNVNINERPVSRSKVPENNATGSVTTDLFDAEEDPNAIKHHQDRTTKSTANILPVEVGDVASASDDLSLSATHVNWEQAFSNVANQDDQTEIADKDGEGDSESASDAESGGSGSGDDFEKIAMLNQADAGADAETKESKVAESKNRGKETQDDAGVHDEGSVKFGKGDKDDDETRQAEKGEQGDTVSASKQAAEREQHENELEHNDATTEPVTKVKASEAYRLAKEQEDELSGVIKTHGALFSKIQPTLETASSETVTKGIKHRFQGVEDGLLSDQATLKAALNGIPVEDTALTSEKSAKQKTKEVENDEIEYTKMEKKMSEIREREAEDQTMKNRKSEDDVTGNSEIEEDRPDDLAVRHSKDGDEDSAAADSKYGSLEQVREKFKTWETKLLKKLDKDKPVIVNGVKFKKSKGDITVKAHEKIEDQHKFKKIDLDKDQFAEESSGRKEDAILKSRHSSKAKENVRAEDEYEDEEDDLADDDQVQSWKNEEKMLLAKLKSPLGESDESTVPEHKVVKLLKTNRAFDEEKALKDSRPSTHGKLVGKSKAIFEDDNHNLNKLALFKEQILAEVKKIDKLHAKYLKEDHSTTELDEAREVLEKDLKVVKQLEKNLKKKPSVTGKIVGPMLHDNSHAKTVKKGNNSYEFSFYASHRENLEPLKGKHPLEEIHSLLREEIRRLKAKKQTPGKHDHQLSNIRKLVQQKLKALVTSGSLNKAELKSLSPEIKELGYLLKKKMKSDKLRKTTQKNRHKLQSALTSKVLLQDSDVQKPVRPGLDSSPNKVISVVKPEAQSEKADKPELTKANAAAQSESSEAEKSLKHVQTQLDKVTPNVTASPAAAQQAATQLSNAQETLGKLANNPSTLASSQTTFKTLLSTLNNRLGEIYNKVQTGIGNQVTQTPTNVSNNKGFQTSGANLNMNLPTSAYNPESSQIANQALPPMSNVFIPSNGQGVIMNGLPIQDGATAAIAQGSAVIPMMPALQSYQPALQPAELYNQVPQNKMSTPEPEEEDVMKPNALADDEPVDTLVENLEKDITEVWSYRDLFPDADKLGLDNEKVHNTYANLGSLSGLNLRRALNRALRGEDVGLAVVGGSISKGGPFSEKGLEYVLRSYFYAVEDWWNKIIRPVTGSSMIIRDVSIGGIATDYYAYCLQNHLPDDKLTNIIVWELSANDMKRYDDGIRPRPQPLEQFTRNVLSYKARPALVYLNFFALFEWDPDLAAHCRNFEDEGEDDIARYYKITSLSWRNMVCPLLRSGTSPLFTRDNLFAEDNFHPSILGHAQMAYILIDYIRTEFLKNLVKMRNTYIADAVARLQIPKAIYIPRPMFAETYAWKPLCHTYMLVDNRSPNNTLPVTEDNRGNFRYTIVREFKIRSDKIVGMDTNLRDQYIRYRLHVPPHPNGDRTPYYRLGIMSFTDDRTAEAQFDSEAPKVLTAKKKFLEGTIVKYVAEKVAPGEHELTIRSGPNGFLICAIVLG